MINLLNTLKEKLGLGSLFGAPEPQVEGAEATATKGPSPRERAAQIQAMNDGQLREFITSLGERAVIRLLQALSDQDLQRRVILALGDLAQETTLKRVTRSEIDKKVKRVAERKLREIGAAASKRRDQKIDEFNERMERFLREPQWAPLPDMPSTNGGQELLSHVFDSAVVDDQSDRASISFARYLALRERIRALVEDYEKTCAELEAICAQTEPSVSVPEAALARLRSRWQDLEEKYSFPKSFETIGRFHRNMEARATTRVSLRKVVEVRPELRQPQQENQGKTRKDENLVEKKAQEERKLRQEAMDTVLAGLREVREKVEHPQVGAELRRLQKECAALRRFRREYAEKFDEAEELLRASLIKHIELVNDGRWDSWARTDRAARILTELEKTLVELEAETDLETALAKSVGLSQRLQEYTSEMKELGRLDREKDYEIWKQFKALCERGWLLCDQKRLQVLEKLKAVFTQNSKQTIEFSEAGLSKATIDLLEPAFDPEVSAKIKELHSVWSRIGSRKTDANREAERIFSRLFELYFRKLNLHLGQIRRQEMNSIQEKRELLLELQKSCTGQPETLVERARFARKMMNRWDRAPLPEGVEAELQNQFNESKAHLNSELTGAMEKQVALAVDAQTRVNRILEDLRAQVGTNVSQALRTVSVLEEEVSTIEKQLTRLKEVLQPDVSGESVQTRFKQVRDQVKALIEEAVSSIKAEVARRRDERGKVLREAEALAISTDWESSRSRFEELRRIWKVVGVSGESQDPIYELFFEHVWQIYCRRTESKSMGSEGKMKALESGTELLLSLEALGRFAAPLVEAKSARILSQLPFNEVERAKTTGKVLELGLRYKHILSLDPKGGIFKETKKIMEQWSRLGWSDEERLPSYWQCYLERVRALLEISG